MPEASTSHHARSTSPAFGTYVFFKETSIFRSVWSEWMKTRDERRFVSPG
jgi:hypothetical protein